MMAVSAAPTRMPTMGLLKDTISWANHSSSFRNFMEPLISSMPVMRAIKPSRMVPIFLDFSDFTNIYRMIPMVPSSGARVEGFRTCTMKLSPSRPLKERIHAVTTLLPMMTPTACSKVIMPELTKPTTMTVVAEEDWITAVTAMPSRKPLGTLELIFARIVCNLPPAIRSRAEPMVSMPNRNRASPPSRDTSFNR